MCNILDLLSDAKSIVQKNNSISMPYIFYQGMLMVGTGIRLELLKFVRIVKILLILLNSIGSGNNILNDGWRIGISIFYRHLDIVFMEFYSVDVIYDDLLFLQAKIPGLCKIIY